MFEIKLCLKIFFAQIIDFFEILPVLLNIKHQISQNL